MCWFQPVNDALNSKKHLTVITAVLVFLLGAVDVVACPGCTYERMLNSNWYPKVWIIKLSLPLLFSCLRLDPVRVFGVFLGYTYGFIFLFERLVWYGHPAVNDGLLGTLANVLLLIFGLNIPDAALLFLLGNIPFFRRRKEQGLPVWMVLSFGATACFAGWLIFRSF